MIPPNLACALSKGTVMSCCFYSHTVIKIEQAVPPTPILRWFVPYPEF